MRAMKLAKATVDSERGTMPSPELLAATGGFNDEFAAAGVRVALDDPARTVVDGSFPVTGELVAGFWPWEVADLAEAVAWVERCPDLMPGPSQIEVRPLYEAADSA